MEIRLSKRLPSHGKSVDVKKVLELYNTGLSMAAVGRITGHQHGVINYHLKRNNIKIRSQRESRRKPISNEKIKHLYLSGLSAPAISEKLNITNQCIYDRLAEARVKTREHGEAQKLAYKTGRYIVLSGEKSSAWKGGRSIDQNGYVEIRINKKKYFEHRFVWEKVNGKIPKGYIIHHLNGDKQDNRIENLCMLPRKEHSPKTITEPYKKQIRELERKLKIMELNKKEKNEKMEI